MTRRIVATINSDGEFIPLPKGAKAPPLAVLEAFAQLHGAPFLPNRSAMKALASAGSNKRPPTL